MTFTKFGKNEIKKWRLSPDAICQMAYQLTNFKIRNKFSMTYEAALARIFKVENFLYVEIYIQQSLSRMAERKQSEVVLLPQPLL